MTTLSDKILGTIDKKKLEPIPKWNFIAKNFGFWGLSILFFIAGIVVSSMFFLFAHEIELWDFAVEKPLFLLSIGVLGIFLFWALMSVVMVIFSKFSVEHTKKGYKYPLAWILSAVFIIQIISGAAFANTDIAKESFEKYETKIPFRQTLTKEREKFWNHPKEGFLSGKITKISGNFLEIEDRDQKKWKIPLTENTQFSPQIQFSTGEIIRIRGEKESSGIFSAEKIFPHKGRQKNLKKFLEHHPKAQKKIRNKMEEIRKESHQKFLQKKSDIQKQDISKQEKT